MEPGSFQWCTVTVHEATGTDWNTWNSVRTSGNTFLLWGWPSKGTGCPKRWWSLHLWRSSKPDGTQSWATCSSRSCLGRGIGQDDLKS